MTYFSSNIFNINLYICLTTYVSFVFAYVVPGKWPRSYERVPDLNDVDPNDIVAVIKAREQRVRDR